jgi:hypothetical protein
MLTRSRKTACHIKSVPDEVFEHRIFNYFRFSYWVKNFTRVCKHWKKICENAKKCSKAVRYDIGRQFYWYASTNQQQLRQAICGHRLHLAVLSPNHKAWTL